MNSDNWQVERMGPEDTANKIRAPYDLCDQPYRTMIYQYGINNNNNALSSYMALGGAHQGCSR